MRRGAAIGWAGVLALFVVVSAAASPAPAAGAATEVQRPRISASVFLGKTRGYYLGIGMPKPSVAVLYAVKAGERPVGGFAESAYGVRVPSDALRRGVIRARFPSLGKVSLRFDPNGERNVHRAQSYCRGKRRVTQYGTFRGTISLEGEDGYFKVKARARKGAVQRSFRLVCRKGAALQADRGAPLWEYVALGFGYSLGEGAVALLYAVADEGGRTIGLRAAHEEGALPGAEVQVGVLEWRDGMAIGRSAFAENEVPGTLTTSMPGVHPASATLAPPWPFYGEGSFLENSSTSHSWTGTLGVSLPGLDLPLTGEAFKARLCVVSPLKVPDGCDSFGPGGGVRVSSPRWVYR